MRPALLVTFAALCVSVAAPVTLAAEPIPALTTLTPKAIQTALNSDSGWTPHATKDGVTVTRKDVPGLPVPAFKGSKDCTLDADTLFGLIADIGNQTGLSDLLAEAKVLWSDTTGRVHFYQVLASPVPFVSDRYWFLKAQNYWDVGGVDGHHKQTWDMLDPNLYPEAYASVQRRYSDAVITPLNYGSWEVVPLGPGKVRVIYRIVSHPGGSLSDSLAETVTGQTLPDNILNFERVTRAKMGG